MTIEWVESHLPILPKPLIPILATATTFEEFPLPAVKLSSSMILAGAIFKNWEQNILDNL
jgi:hypothetical protein